jgi:hypothetical protein
MIARFDHRPRLTAALALATTLLVVAVVTLSTLLIMAAPPTAPAPSGSVGNNTPVIGAGGEHYGDGWNNYGHDSDLLKPAQTGNGADLSAADRRHAAMVEAYNDNR